MHTQAKKPSFTAGVGALLLCAGLAAPAAAMTPDNAKSHIETLATQALDVLEKGGLGEREREFAFAEVLEDAFALDVISRFALGPHWEKASADQRDRYQQLFNGFVVRTYAERLGGLASSQFSVLEATATDNGDALVASRIQPAAGAPLDITWRVREIDGKPRIVDVMVQAVSMAVTRRDEFSSVVRLIGLDGLIGILRAKSWQVAVTS